VDSVIDAGGCCAPMPADEKITGAGKGICCQISRESHR